MPTHAKPAPLVTIRPTVADDAFDWRIPQAIAQRCRRTSTTVTYSFTTDEDAERFRDAMRKRLPGQCIVK